MAFRLPTVLIIYKLHHHAEVIRLDLIAQCGIIRFGVKRQMHMRFLWKLLKLLRLFLVQRMRPAARLPFPVICTIFTSIGSSPIGVSVTVISFAASRGHFTGAGKSHASGVWNNVSKSSGVVLITIGSLRYWMSSMSWITTRFSGNMMLLRGISLLMVGVLNAASSSARYTFVGISSISQG